MELPRSRVFEAQGRKKPTHDFLSACSNSNLHPDPMPSSQGGYLKTHDFLQPLERVGTRACAKEEGIRGSVDSATASSELKSPYVKNQHVLPGGIGTYTISHIPYSYHTHHHHRFPKSEVSPMFTVSQASSNERNGAEDSISNCSSYAANSGFTLWDESLEKKGHTRKQIARDRANIRDAAGAMGQWQGMEQRSSFSSRSSLQTSGVKSQRQSFMDMLKSAKGSSQEDDLDDDDEEEFVTKKGDNTSTSQCQRVDLKVKLDRKGGNEQKPNTPRSKHSATEQRRRSKINDRFQMLRQLIPNSDQKRDKASFLLEVIEYIHFLQEKVDKQESNHQQPPEGTVPVLTEAEAVDMDHHQCLLNRAIETTSFPVSGQIESSQLCPVSSSDGAAMEDEKLREEEEEEELSVHKGTISISSVYSQGLLKTLSETLQTSGVDLSRSSISVQIKLSKQPQKNEVHRRVRPRSQSGDENQNDDENSNIKKTWKQKKLKKDHSFRNI